MRFQDYPPQEPAAPTAVAYRETCINGSFGVPFSEFRFGSDPHQSVAIYAPERPNGTLFAFLHGGGWTGGYKENMGFMAPAFTSNGFFFASVGYRLAPQHLFPAGVDDSASAVKALAERAHMFGYDANRIFLGGHSAGGHYAALLAVRHDWQAKLKLPSDIIKGCLPLSGVYRFGEGSGLSMRPRFLGAEGNGADRAASALYNIQGSPPPFFMAYGENDFPHLRRQADEMADTLRLNGASVVLIEMPGRNHFTSSLAGGELEGPWVRPAIDFMRAH